jgi:hypothetical protein
MAGAGLQPFAVAPVMPYRTGRTDSDTDFGIFYRPDAVTVLYIPWGEPTVVSHTYHLKRDTAARIWQLMHYDGDSTDLPVVDHVAGLQFEYFEEGRSPLDPATLQDGPWVPDDPEAMKFDADLLKIRRVRVLLRVQAALDSMRGPTSVLFTNGGTSTSVERYLPDLELQFDVAVRNLNLGG